MYVEGRSLLVELFRRTSSDLRDVIKMSIIVGIKNICKRQRTIKQIKFNE